MPRGEYLQYGGQAIIEGVMMRSPRFFSVAVRAPNGEVVLQTEALEKSWIGRQKWLKLPFLRGSLALIDAMSLGMRAMKFASDVHLNPKMQADGTAGELEATGERTVEGSRIVKHEAEQSSLRKIAIGSTFVFAIAFGLGLFVLLPLFLSELFRRLNVHNDIELNVITAAIKFVLFFGYLYSISRMPDIHRVFKYHGAEHKAINTLEADLPLTMENCQRQTRLHPRCGTSFAIIVLLIDMAMFIVLPRYPVHGISHFANLGVRFLINIACLPVFAGIGYELIRFAGKFRNSAFVNVLFAPGLATQLITTAEPEPDQIEIALTSLRACVAAEDGQTPRTGEETIEEAIA